LAEHSRFPRACLKLLIRGVCLGVFAIAAPAISPAQEAAAVPDAPAAPRPLAAADIALEALRLDARLSGIGVRLRPDPAVKAIQRELPSEMETLRSLGETAALDRIESLTLRHLEQIRQPWNMHRTRLDRWQAKVRLRTEEMEALRAEVRAMHDVWSVTAREIAANDPGSGIAASVRDALASIESVDDRLAARLEELITLQGRIAGGLIGIARALEEIEAARADARQRLFRIDRPLLWKEMAVSWERGLLIDQARESWITDWRIVGGFLVTHWHVAVLHALILTALVILLSAMRRAGRRWGGENPAVQAARPILDRPYSAAILIGLMFTFFLYGEAPARLHEVALLAALIPCLRLLPAIFGAGAYRPLVVASLLFVLDRLTALLFGAPIIYRLALMATTGGALLAFVHVLHRGLPAIPVPPGAWRPLFVGLGRTAIALLGISAVANLWGNVTLAQILTDGTLRSAYLTIMLYAITFVVDGLLALSLGLPAVRTLRTVQFHSDLIRTRARAAMRAALLVLWVSLTLDLFALLTPVVAGVHTGLSHRWTVGTVNISLGDIAAFVITLWISTLLARLVSYSLESEVMPRLGVGRGVPEAVALLSRNFILVIGFFLALAAAGIEIGRFALLMGALGVGIGFGLQNVVSNFISGLILAFERPIHVGDTIEVGPLLGRVMTIGFRSSTIQTYEGADVIVPNTNLISGELVNWTLSDQTRRIEIKVGVAYGSDPHRVIEILTGATRGHADVLHSPQPLALFRGFGDSSLDFSLWFWTAEFQRCREVAGQVTLAVHDGMGAAGISIPFPQRDLHLRSVDPGAARSLRDGGA